MADYYYMAEHTYSQLQDQGDAGNVTYDILLHLKDMAGSMYPDNYRLPPRIEDFEAAVNDFEKYAADYVAFLRKLIETDKGE
jgi:hypothetical protein